MTEIGSIVEYKMLVLLHSNITVFLQAIDMHKCLLMDNWSLWCCLIARSNGVKTCVEPMKHDSSKRLRQYFLWHREIPSHECETSIPKSFSLPKSLILNVILLF